MSDLITDILVLKEYWEGGEATLLFRNLTLASLLVSVALQLLVVLIQNRKKRVSKMLKEVGIVLLGMKSPWDAFKVASGAEREKDAEFDPMMEMTVSKCIEMFAESLPGIMIQLSSIIKSLNTEGGTISHVAITSLFLSTFTTGFVSATISYDLDTDPTYREQVPDFYGYIPDSKRKRSILFLTMMNMAAVQALLKSLLVVTLGSIDPMYAWLYLLADLIFYFGYKVLRRDFTTWMPFYGVLGFAVSFLVRFCVKLIADYTATIHFRHPKELGGLYFSMNSISPFVGMVVLLTLMEEGTFNDITTEVLTNVTVFLGAALLTLTSAFFLLIKEKFRRTFYSVRTGIQQTQISFLRGEDEEKAAVFVNHTSHWYPIKDKVEKWVQSGWHRWEVEKPEWFNDDFKCDVPEHMKPKRRKSRQRGAADIEPDKNATPVRRGSFLVNALAKKPNNVAPAANRSTKIDIEAFKREIIKGGSVF
ncbi:hypothetical protein TrLO_g12103 [Triparma laevis f. longispina]|nr:hypothetical protein TrLO_g12103 [Triparma laevis f. longispina]